MARIITGHTGEDHITSDDVSSFQKGIVGEYDYLLSDNPENFTATINANGTISLCDADIIIQGTHARIYSTDVVALEPGTNGSTRIDSIIVRYIKDDNGVESVDVIAKKGTTEPPVLELSDIRGVGTIREVALWNITFNGTIPNMPVRVIPVINSLNALQKSLQNSVTTLNNSIKQGQNSFNSTVNQINSKIEKVAANSSFPDSIVIYHQNESTANNEYSDTRLNSFVSTFNDKTGAKDITGFQIALRDKNKNLKSEFRVYSDGRIMSRVNNVLYKYPFIQFGYVSSLAPSTKSTENAGTVTVGGTLYTVKRDYYTITKNVIFPIPFAETPRVYVTLNTTVPHRCSIGVNNVSKTGFTINLVRINGSATDVSWLAVQQLG